MKIFLTILLFIVSLSLLIMIHEAGHLSAAKIFRVYCDDFSLGFGPAILHKKRKKGETYFSIRVVPFGGFVSIAEKEGELPSGANVPHERSLEGIKKWKTAIIMASGVAMNFLLAYFLLLSNNLFFETKMLYSNCVDVKEASIAETAGIKTSQFERDKFISGDLISYITDSRNATAGKRIFYYDVNSYATFEDDSVKPCIATIYETSLSYNSECSFNNIIKYYGLTEDLENANYSDEVNALSKNSEGSKIKSMTFDPLVYHRDSDHSICSNCHSEHLSKDLLEKDGKYYCPTCDLSYKHSEYLIFNSAISATTPMVLNVIAKGESLAFDEIGLSLKHIHFKYSFTEAFGVTGKQYCDGATLIFRGLGNLLTGKGWDQTGGIISVYTQSASVLETMGFGYYLYYWGLISINLGIVNLFPFPGLDGWQLLVLAIEGITRKKVPAKAKTIMSYIGIALLFGLMIFLVVKDIFRLI